MPVCVCEGGEREMERERALVLSLEGMALLERPSQLSGLGLACVSGGGIKTKQRAFGRKLSYPCN